MRVEIDPSDLAPIVRQVVAEVMQHAGTTAERIGYPEAEAAALIGVQPYVLRDARRRGEVAARKVGRGYVYERGSLIAFLKGSNGK